MKLIDRLLAKVGLKRLSQDPFEYVAIEWLFDEPTYVDIRLKNGLRASGYLKIPRSVEHHPCGCATYRDGNEYADVCETHWAAKYNVDYDPDVSRWINLARAEHHG